MIYTRASRFIIALVFSSLVYHCTEERALSPNSVEPIIYAGGSYFSDTTRVSLINVIYALDADSLTKRDSIVLESPSSRMASGPDGRTLFIQLADASVSSRRIVALDVPEQRLLWTFPQALLLGALDSGRIVLVGMGTNSFGVVDATDGTLVREIQDSVTFYAGESYGTEAIAWVSSENGHWLRAFDCLTGVMRGGYHPRLLTGDTIDVRFATLHPDGHRVLSIGRRNSNTDSWFVVGDLDRDSTLLDYNLIYSQGEIAVNADGTIAAVSDPSSPFHDSVRNLSIFDLRALKLLKRLVEPEVVNPARVRFVNGRSALAMYPYASSAGPVQVIELKRFTTTSMAWLPELHSSQTQRDFVIGAFDVAPSP